MTEGTSSGEENDKLYMRGVNDDCVGGFLDGEELLAILDGFGQNGFRAYIVRHVEGVADAMEGLEDRNAAETKQPKVTKTEKGSSPIRNPSRYSGEVGYPPPAHRGGGIQDLVYALPSIPYSHDVGE